MTKRLRFLVLGTAAGGGLPQWNCGCPNCKLARDPDSSLRSQTQSSLAVSIDGISWAILNASPDIRQQLTDHPQLHPKALRDSPIHGVVLTNGDIDHVAGLLVLREKQAFSLFTTEALDNLLDDNPVFRALDMEFVTRRTITLDKSFELLPDLQATLFPVPGKLPLFMESGAVAIGGEGEQTVGVELAAEGFRVFYIPGCAMMSDSLANRISGADLLFFDGTLFTDDEMIVTGTGKKTGRRMGHMPISGEGGSLAALAPLSIRQTVYVHINNTNPIWRDGPERDLVRKAGIDIGYDGMEIELAAST